MWFLRGDTWFRYAQGCLTSFSSRCLYQNTCIYVGSLESLFRKPRKWNVNRQNTSTLTKADRKLMIRSTIRTSRLTESGNRAKNFQLTRDPRYFSNPRIRSIYRWNPQSVSFLRPNPPIHGPIHHPPLCSLFHEIGRSTGTREHSEAFLFRSAVFSL